MDPSIASASGSAEPAVEQPTREVFQTSANQAGRRERGFGRGAIHNYNEYANSYPQGAYGVNDGRHVCKKRGSNRYPNANRHFRDNDPNNQNYRGGFSQSSRGNNSGKQKFRGRDSATTGAVSDNTTASQHSPQIIEYSQTITETAKEFSNLCLREDLIQKLRCGQYSCLICLCSILPREEIWSCDDCYHMYHLKCMTEWALSAKLGKQDPNERISAPKNTWRCPSCQKEHSSTNKPLIYRCFCGRKIRPEYHPGHTTIPHGCDEICGKQRKTKEAEEGAQACPHACTELCHPGPCPPCVSTVDMSCPCGRVVRRARCGERPPSPCGARCTHVYRTPLGSGPNKCAFGGHPCPELCHYGDCPPCPQLIKAVCYCGRLDELTICGGEKASRYHLEGVDPVEDELDACDLECLSEADAAVARRYDVLERALFVGTVFSCEQPCGRMLNCRHHKCQALCHPGDCQPCQLLPEFCLTCPCGRVPLSKLVMSGDPHGDRTRCTDPVPVCPNVCGRPNPVCGHPCPAKCHAGECPPCKLTTTITCRCGRSTKEVTCSEVVASSGALQMTCERICRKKKTCGRHKCKNQCCDMVIHACMEICGRTLSCGKHTCEDPCHCGPCGSCWRGVIYDEVRCYCGCTVLSPPQPCGTKPPECDQPCTREHPCGHPVRHTCHSGAECPPCTDLVAKPCPGGHTLMYNVPCFQIVATCGRVCDKPLPGCIHRCQRLCHAGDCLGVTSGGPRDAVDHCTQPCPRPRPECGHPCALPCHDVQGLTCAQAIAKSAPKCRTLIDLLCLCGRRKESQPCFQVKNLARQLEKKDLTIFLRAQTTAVGESGLPFGLASNAILPCDSSCAKQKKAEKAAAAAAASGEPVDGGAPKLWVRGGAHLHDESLPPPFPPPEYSDWLKQFASNNIVFAQDVEQKLIELVEQALVPLKEGETPTTKCPSHRFPPMNKYKRRFIKELAEFYGVETVAFDPEPHRHLLAMTTLATACYPGGSRQHHVKLSSQVQKQFTGSVKITGVESGVANRVASVRSSVEVASASTNQVLKPVSFSVASTSSSSANAFEDS